MQTFLPYADFHKSARVLDRQRLGKQRVECLQILRTLYGVTDGWRNHPAVKMWRGYETALLNYGFAITGEWVARGYRDTCHEKMMCLFLTHGEARWPVVKPPWLCDPRFHESHRSNLLRKLPGHYRNYWPKLRDDIPYVWPGKQ